MTMILWMMLNVIFYISGTGLPYYCKYIFHDDSLYGGMGLTSAIITGLMSWSGYISSTTADAVQPQSAIDMIVGIY